MNYVLLSGGSGKRLWPLSNEVRSKQFLKILRDENGVQESMVQRMNRMIRRVDNKAKITFATSANQVPSIKSQLGDSVSISVEPCRRDTFPAIALAVAFLHDVNGISGEEPVVVCPVDPYVGIEYFHVLHNLDMQARKEEVNLVLMGIEPTYPSEKYGYIIPCDNGQVSWVKEFKEKPDANTAEKYIASGALWNAGVFAFQIDYLLKKTEELFGFNSYEQIFFNYEGLTRISFDYAVAEHEKKIQVIRYAGEWKDLGTWNTLTEGMSDAASGKTIVADCENTHVINELQIPLIALGTRNLAIAATPDGILVTDKGHSDKLKNYVVDQRPMFEQREWGQYNVLDYRVQSDGKNSLTKHLMIKAGQHISYQRHSHRTEIWTCTDGIGKIIINGKVSEISRGSIVCIPAGVKHAIMAVKELHIIEVQIGDELTEEDIERLEWNWSE